MKIVSQFCSTGGTKSSVSQDLLKIFGLCKIVLYSQLCLRYNTLRNLIIFHIWLLLRLKTSSVKDFRLECF